MTNKEIARLFNEMAALMELHDDNPFKIKSYAFAYRTLRSLDQPLTDMKREDIDAIKGVGKATGDKIQEIFTSGTFPALEAMRVKTPEGVREMLNIKGFGPKKIQTIWQDMQIESVGELLYACYENRLVEYKGFGAKTQDDLRRSLEYYLAGRDKVHFAQAEQLAQDAQNYLAGLWPDITFHFGGDVWLQKDIVERIEILAATNSRPDINLISGDWRIALDDWDYVVIQKEDGFPMTVRFVPPQSIGTAQFQWQPDSPFGKAVLSQFPDFQLPEAVTEQELAGKAEIPYLAPERRHVPEVFEPLLRGAAAPRLIEQADMHGVLHVHTTYSDGANTLRDMCTHARGLGYTYIGISDHSQAAFYANGLKPDRLEQQWADIEALNKTFTDFRIFKSIECDILADGSLDYTDEILSRFDFVIASVHSNLRMDETKATERILRAIENPHTAILGHPTGRLLLARPGYPLDHRRIIEACAKHNVAIELNANPHRLDLDYTHIPLAMKLGVRIAVNPDAHSLSGLEDVRFGLLSARKGGLTPDMCLNTLDADAFEHWITERKKRGVN